MTLTFRLGTRPNVEEVAQVAQARGYRMLRDSLTISFADNQTVWRFGAVAMERSRAISPALLADELSPFEGQIGRASCRARVCRYVTIWGVADRYKKKIK